jgi:hypothetical protein
MKKFIVLCLLVLLSGFGSNIWAYIIDGSDTGLYSDYNINNFGQSFTTAAAGEITEIRITAAGEETNTTLRIFTGEGVSEIYSQAVSFTAGEYSIVLTTPVPVNASTLYSFIFDQASLSYASPGLYSEGRMVYSGTWLTGYDLWFQITIDDEVPLPVTLSAFSAVFSNGSSMLQWTTQSESNNLGWNVFRSDTDDIENSIQVNSNMIDGAGTTTEQTNYSFIDENETSPNTSYWYWLENVDQSGTTNTHGPVKIDIPDDGDNEFPPELIPEYGLAQNFPNPFNPNTMIAFKLSDMNVDTAELVIYNQTGQLIKTFDNLITDGTEIGHVNWDGTDSSGDAVSSGIYLYKMKAGGRYTSTKKMILLK